MNGTPAPYVPAPGADALARRLRSLCTANVPVACRVYLGLDRPGPSSARHAEATWARASHLVAGTVDELPHFNTNPPPILRVLAAASLGRPDALGPRMSDLPADLASDLWGRVDARLRDPETLAPDERGHASDLMLRLGYVDAAAAVLGLRGADAATHTFGRDTLLAEFPVFVRGRHDRAVLEARALDLARDRTRSAHERAVMATYVVVRNGKRGTETPELDAAVELALAAIGEIDADDLAVRLLKQTVFRAVAFQPFLRRDLAGTMVLLDRAIEHQMAARAYARSGLETLAWIDHAFPLYETIARTQLRLGDAAAAVVATDELVRLSPNDARTWDARGQALIAAGRLEAAIEALGRALPLGGLPVAKAAYYLGWLHEQLGHRDLAHEHYRLSWRIDPTVPAVVERIERQAA